VKTQAFLFFAAAQLLGTALAPVTARATAFHPPAQMESMPARVLVGLRVSGPMPGNFIAWQEGLSGEGACSFERISDEGQLPQDASVHGTQGDNHILMIPRFLVPRGEVMRFCGHEWRAPKFGTSKERVLAIHGEGGNDVIFTGLQSPPPEALEPWPEIHGGEGDDTIVAQQARDVFGDAGNDFILAWFNPTGTLSAGSGDDTVCWGNDLGIPPDGPGAIDGGEDVDDCFGSAPSFVGCENHAAFYPTSNPAWFKRECWGPAKAAKAALLASFQGQP